MANKNENNDLNLKDIASKAKNNYKITTPTGEGVDVVNEVPEKENSGDNKNDTSTDTPTIIFGDQSFNNTDETSGLSSEDIGPSGGGYSITDAELKAVMPDLDELTYKVKSEELRTSITGYRKKLIINGGLTIEEANDAAKNRLKREGGTINDEYLKENPKLGIVEIDKKNVDKVEFTPEEKAKLEKAKVIRLNVVEDAELKTIKVEKVDKKTKASMLKTIEGTLAKYSLPLPVLGDFVTFRGAQIIQLIGTVKYEDESLDELINKKASLIYDRLVGGTNYTKYDDENKVTLSYTDFANSFKFHDIDLGLFGILVASSMEEVESNLTCSQCEESFSWKYNLKLLLNLDGVSDRFKEIIDTIIGKKSDPETLSELSKKLNKVYRFKSPITNNIYDISYPSIAKTVKMYQSIDQKDTTMIYLSTAGIFLNSIYIYNKEKDSYLQIEEDEIKTMMEALQMIPQKDLDILFLQIKDMLYTPEFKLNSQCPACGHKMVNSLSVDDLIFLRAQDSSTEIR